MNFIQIDYTKVKGFAGLTEEQQQLFIETYKIHNSVQGNDYKENYEPISVKWVADKVDDRFSKLKVIFKNGEWLYYTKIHEWF